MILKKDIDVNRLTPRNVRKQRLIIDEGGDKFTPLNIKAMKIIDEVVRGTIEGKASDADVDESTMTSFAPQNIKTMILITAVDTLAVTERVDAVVR